MPAEVVRPQWELASVPEEGVEAVVIIVDDGRAPRVLLVPDPPRAVLGCRFHHHDRTWVVTRRRPHTRVFIARPAQP